MYKEHYFEVLPCHPNEDGTQKCHIGACIFKDLDAKLGHCILIRRENKTFVCKLWPKENWDQKYIQFDDSVYASNENSDAKISSKSSILQFSSKGKCYIQKECIQFRKVVEFDNIDIEVVVYDHKQFLKYTGKTDQLLSNIKDILCFVIFNANCIIKVNKVLYGRCGVACIIIKQTSAKKEDICGKINDRSSITISKIHSQQRYDQQNKFKNIKLGGINTAKESLKQLIEIPLRQNEKLNTLGIKCPRSVLLRGPSGCGKSSLVKVVAHECNAYLMVVIASELRGSRPGETEHNLRDAFERALITCKEGPCILFVDEVDCLGARKSNGNKALAQFVQLLDKLNEVDENLVVVAATNRPEDIDQILRRPGRLDREIFIGIPTQDQRQDILKSICSDLNISSDVRFSWLAEATPGFVGADLNLLVQQAYYKALDDAAGNEQETEVIYKSHFDQALHNTTPSLQKGSDVFIDVKPMHWNDIGGLQEVKDQIKQAIELPIKHPDAFKRLGQPCPKGVLLYGPPGCAKTILVRAAATSCHVTFLSVSGAQLYSPFVGDSEKKISEIFKQARAGAPCILFLDEIDSLVGKRSEGSKQGGVQERVLSTLLNEMDGIGVKVDSMQSFSQETTHKAMIAEGSSDGLHIGEEKTSTENLDNSSVLVVAATNRPDMLDDAILRPGRIDRIIYVPPPDKQARYEIFKVHTQKMAIDSDVNINELCDRTEYFTGAELENLCREAALHALSVEGLEVPSVKHEHFVKVLENIQPCLTPSELQRYSSIKFRK